MSKETPVTKSTERVHQNTENDNYLIACMISTRQDNLLTLHLKMSVLIQ